MENIRTLMVELDPEHCNVQLIKNIFFSLGYAINSICIPVGLWPWQEFV